MSTFAVAVVVIPGACGALFVLAMRWLGRHVTCAVWRPDLAQHYAAGHDEGERP